MNDNFDILKVQLNGEDGGWGGGGGGGGFG